MTTRLAGLSTSFLPFNRGVDGAAGNSPDRAALITAAVTGQIPVEEMRA
jgi:type I restriction enzyme R subunit